MLDDLNGLSANDTLTISGQYGYGDFPTAVFTTDVTLSDEDLSATADIIMTARGTARISVQNQSRVAADLLLYQGDKLFYTKETFIASHASTYDYVYSSGWSPRLPAGSYTVYVVNRDYLRTVDPTTYQTESKIQFEKGTYTSAPFTIRDNETTSVTLNVPDVVQEYADVNFEMSSVTMSVDFPGPLPTPPSSPSPATSSWTKTCPSVCISITTSPSLRSRSSPSPSTGSRIRMSWIASTTMYI